ncbi:MAG: hypothetical protein MZU91_12750 [Desulfosudis oleivorans]|nr:hypothetical protein [Desulfosudis oleivorans]
MGPCPFPRLPLGSGATAARPAAPTAEPRQDHLQARFDDRCGANGLDGVAGGVCLRRDPDAEDGRERPLSDFSENHGIYGAVSLQAAAGADLIAQVVSAFKVSADAARVRLLKLNLVTEAALEPVAFPPKVRPARSPLASILRFVIR